MSVWSLGAMMDAPKVEALLADVDRSNEGRLDFTPAIEREQVSGAISALLWMYGCRSSDTAAIYAYMALMQSLGIDWQASTIVRISPAALQEATPDVR